MRSITVYAPAKLNLALSVGPRQADGMHPIASWMVTVDLFDDLTLTRLDHDRMSRYAVLWHKGAKRRSAIDWSISKDLTVRAHLALEQHVSRHLPVQMKLEKRIPVGGGLGGGSSDAAAMLHGMNELFELNLKTSVLASIGASVGSDVPFLIHGGSAIVEGLGDRITPHEAVPPLHAVIAFPDAKCATAKVYGLLDELGGSALKAQEVKRLAMLSGAVPLSEALFNDLAGPALRCAPQLEDDLARLSELAQRPAHLTGSGASIFVLCDDEVHALALAEASERKLSLPAVNVRSGRFQIDELVIRG